ncbi:MAG: DUF937 domain-containing protein [Rhodoferax sp.]|jgi:hypothetical protein|nr:DUF937 domain-containing protein [Rhodoferax sp.]MCP5287548.1 DUF937 domain-containing protein [Burkholderiaceae bacterium]
MQLTDLLGRLGGLQSMARELGVSEQQAASGADALLPAILGGFKRQAQSQPSGLEGLGGLLGQLGGGSLMDEVLAPQATPVQHGNDVLGQIFGSKDVSRAVAGQAAAQTGLDASLLKKMLPMLAMLVAGMMARSQSGGAAGAGPSQGGGLGDLLGGLMGGAAGGSGAGMASGGGGGLGDLLGGLMGGGRGGAGGLGAMLDMDGNGNPLDDILRMVAQRR